MKPTQVIDMQADLLQRMGTEGFRRMVEMTIDAGSRGSGPQFYRAAHSHIQAAYAYRVSEDMSTLIEFAASQLESSDVFDRSLAPTGCGIVRFDKPLPVTDARGKSMSIHWLTWGPIQGYRVTAFGQQKDAPGIMAMYWNDTAEPDEVQRNIVASSDPKQQEFITRIAGRWGVVGAEINCDGEPVGSAQTPISADYAAKILANGDTPQPFTNSTRYLHALWLLLNQTVTDVREEYLPKTGQKVARRAGIPPRVTVVQLRRSAGSRGTGESLVQWSRRWVVRGHWRWQAHGPQRAERRRIWVAPHVKGPEGKPLVATTHVYNVSR